MVCEEKCVCGACLFTDRIREAIAAAFKSQDVLIAEIIGILDLEKTTVSMATITAFREEAKRAGD